MMKPHYRTLLATLALGTAVAHAQKIESVEVEDGNMKLRVRTPSVEIERMNPDGTFTTESITPPEATTVEIDVPADDPRKIVRARIELDGKDLGSTVRPLVEEGLVPDPQRFRPSAIGLDGELLNIQYPQGAAPDPEQYPQGFPIFLPQGTVMLEPDARGGFSGQLPAGTAEAARQDIATAMHRLRGIGEGTVPVFAGRGLTGFLQVPDPDTLGDRLELFPFVNGGLFEPVTVPGTPILGSPAAVDPAKSLLITDLSVVEDPSRTFDPGTGAGTPLGAWTFGRLMADMCHPTLTGLDPKLFAARWIQHFETPQVINFDPVPDRGGSVQTQLIDKWNAHNTALGRHPFDLRLAPFRLTAIVNRVDLRDGSGYATGNAGELRFVFCAIDLDNGAHLPMTVIFEYGVPLSGCIDVKNFASDWQALTSMPFDPVGSPGLFNMALQNLTDLVALAGKDPTKPNHSAINQLRSNNFLGGPWTLREWQITGSGVSPNDLTEVTVKQTPANSENNTTDLRDYINAEEPNILAGAHLVPLSFPASSPFLAGKADTLAPSFFWDAPGIANNDARHCFSVATCNGCHGGEASGAPFNPPVAPPGAFLGSFPFVHIGERDPGVEAALSNFLLGTNMPMADPVSGVPRTFDDLTRRAADLDFVANAPCLLVALMPSLVMSH